MMEAPTLQVLRQLPTGEISNHRLLVEQICAADWTGTPPGVLLDEVAQNRISVWAIEGVDSGIALVRLLQRPVGRVLHLDGLGGHNVLPKAQAIGADLETLARFFQCRSIETAAADERWQAVAKRLGFAVVTTIFAKEL